MKEFPISQVASIEEVAEKVIVYTVNGLRIITKKIDYKNYAEYKQRLLTDIRNRPKIKLNFKTKPKHSKKRN